MTSPTEPVPAVSWIARRAPLLLGLSAVAVVFREVLTGATLFFADFSTIHHPLERFGADRIASGGLPVWNPDLALGLPQLANPIAASLYPPNLLLAVLPFTWTINVLQAAHVALALWLMGRLVRALSGDAPGVVGWAGLLGGAAFALSGAMLSSTAYGYPVLAWPWVALVALGALRLAERQAPGRGTAMVALGVGLSLLAGDPTAAATATLLGLALLLALAAPGGRLRAAALLALAVALGVCLAGAQVLPTLAFLPESVRAQGGAPGSLGTWSLAPERLLGFAQPAFWGRFAPEMSYWGQHLAGTLNDGSFFYASHYIGVAPLVLAPLALGDERTRRAAIALLSVAVLALTVSLGRHLPGFEALVRAVPGLGLLRYPERWVMASTVALAALGGLGLTALARAEYGRGARAVAVLVAGAIVAISAAVLVLDETLREVVRAHALVPIEDAARDAQITGALLAGSLALVTGGAAAAATTAIYRLRTAAYPFASVVLVATLGLADAALGNGGLIWTAPADLFEAPAATVTLLEQQTPGEPLGPIARHDGLNRVRMHRDLKGLVDRYRAQLATLRGNAVLEAGAARVGAETPARLGHPVQPDTWLLGDPVRVAPLLGVRALLVSASRPPEAVRRASPSALRLVGGVPPLGLAVVSPQDPPMPGAFCVGRVAAVPRSRVALALAALDPRTTAVVEPEAVLGPREGLADRLVALSGAPETRAWPCASVRREHTRIMAQVSTERPALLVLQSAFAGGWSATVDGAPWPILRAYGSLEALPLDAGDHEVELRYEAPGLTMGLWASGLAGLAVLLLWLMPLGRMRRGRRA